MMMFMVSGDRRSDRPGAQGNPGRPGDCLSFAHDSALRASILRFHKETQMAISMYSVSAPTFIRMLGNLQNWLDKAQAHAEARKFDPNNFIGLRLAPDMLPLNKQVQIASDMAKGCMGRLAGAELPKWDDNEATLAELRARAQKTIDYVKSFNAAQIDGSEGREITIPTRAGEPLKFDGETYLKHYALPNFYFHVTTAYALLRHGGVVIGKSDYLGGR
jgi:uncharacterized protein